MTLEKVMLITRRSTGEFTDQTLMKTPKLKRWLRWLLCGLGLTVIGSCTTTTRKESVPVPRLVVNVDQPWETNPALVGWVGGKAGVPLATASEKLGVADFGIWVDGVVNFDAERILVFERSEVGSTNFLAEFDCLRMESKVPMFVLWVAVGGGHSLVFLNDQIEGKGLRFSETRWWWPLVIRLRRIGWTVSFPPSDSPNVEVREMRPARNRKRFSF